MDPYRFMSFLTRQVMRAWADREQPAEQVAWTSLQKPLAECRVALISSAGIALRSDKPFDQQGERENPWWGDPSWRELPAETSEADVQIYHMHIDAAPAKEDLDVVFPTRRLRELVEAGIVGAVSPRHFSIMGYILDATELVNKTAPELASALMECEVDLALLVPV